MQNYQKIFSWSWSNCSESLGLRVLLQLRWLRRILCTRQSGMQPLSHVITPPSHPSSLSLLSTTKDGMIKKIPKGLGYWSIEHNTSLQSGLEWKYKVAGNKNTLIKCKNLKWYYKSTLLITTGIYLRCLSLAVRLTSRKQAATTQSLWPQRILPYIPPIDFIYDNCY